MLNHAVGLGALFSNGTTMGVSKAVHNRADSCVPSAGPQLASAEAKVRQASKIRELRAALIEAGLIGIDLRQ